MYQRVAYISVRPVRVSDAIVRLEVVEPSIVRNTTTGITSCLWHDSVNFFQVVEGPADNVALLMARIRVDHRHYGVRVIADHPVGSRSFPEAPLKLVAGRAGDLVGDALTRALERGGAMGTELLREPVPVGSIPEADRNDPERAALWRSKPPWLDEVVAHLIAAPSI